MLVRGVAASIIILLAGSAAVAGEGVAGRRFRSAADAGRDPNSGGAGHVGFERLRERPDSLSQSSALPADYFATTPYLLGEWPGIRSKLSDLGIQVVADRRRRSGHEPLRRSASERARSRTGRPAGSIRPAKEFGPDRRAVSS